MKLSSLLVRRRKSPLYKYSYIGLQGYLEGFIGLLRVVYIRAYKYLDRLSFFLKLSLKYLHGYCATKDFPSAKGYPNEIIIGILRGSEVVKR